MYSSSAVEVEYFCIVQVSSLATACIGQPLLIVWSHSEQSCMFALIVAALNL